MREIEMNMSDAGRFNKEMPCENAKLKRPIAFANVDGLQMGEAGRSRVEELFDLHRMASSYEALYAKLVTAKGSIR